MYFPSGSKTHLEHQSHTFKEQQTENPTGMEVPMKLFLRAATDLIMSGVFYKTFTLVILFSIGVSTATAANWYVDAALGNDMNSCTAPGVGNACQSIQAAINKASS